MQNNIISELVNSSIPGYVFSMLIPMLFLIIMLKDKQSKYVILYFCWGLFSVFFAFVINEWFILDQKQVERLTSSIAPIVEEALKALPLLLLFRTKNQGKNLIIYCAMASGIGFSVQETIFYFSNASIISGLPVLLPLFVRTVTTCLMHGMSTAILGFGITITINYKNIRIPLILGLLALSATLHSLFNVLIHTRLAIIAFIMPSVLYFLGLMLLSEDEVTTAEEGDEHGR